MVMSNSIPRLILKIFKRENKKIHEEYYTHLKKKIRHNSGIV